MFLKPICQGILPSLRSGLAIRLHHRGSVKVFFTLVDKEPRTEYRETKHDPPLDAVQGVRIGGKCCKGSTQHRDNRWLIASILTSLVEKKSWCFGEYREDIFYVGKNIFGYMAVIMDEIHVRVQETTGREPGPVL